MPVIYFEYVFSHSALEYLSCMLASSSIPVLRIDGYLEIDKAGPSELFDVQVGMAERGVEWVKEKTGCKKVCAIGLLYGGAVISKLSCSLGSHCEGEILSTGPKSYFRRDR